MRIVLAALSFSPHQPNPQKLETLFLEVHSRPKGDRLRRRSGPAGVERSDINTRLLFIEFKFPSCQLFLYPSVHFRPLPFAAKNDEVVGILTITAFI